MSKILIVEDEATLRNTLALNLRAEGFEVLAAGDGTEGLKLAREQAPDAVILDLMLPELDGLSLCRILRRDSDVPILMLTARGTEMDRIAGLETGADDYVVKPFSLGELMARVRALLRRAGAKRVLQLPGCNPATSPSICSRGASRQDRESSSSLIANLICWRN